MSCEFGIITAMVRVEVVTRAISLPPCFASRSEIATRYCEPLRIDHPHLVLTVVSLGKANTTSINPDIDRYYDNPTAGANGKGLYYYDFYHKDAGWIDPQAGEATE